MFVMTRQNYRVNAYIGVNECSMTCLASVLDTGAGSSFIKKEILPAALLERVKGIPNPTDIRDASNRRVSILGKIRLRVRLGSRSDWVHFNVVQNLGTEVILGCDFMDKHVDAIRPRKRKVTLDDGTSVPILRRHTPSKWYRTMIPEPEAASDKTVNEASKVKILTPIVLKPGSQTWVEVTTAISGTVLMEPNGRLYRNHTCLASNGVAEVEADKPFKVLVANFGDYPKQLAQGQVVATAYANPTNLVESTISHAELLGLCDDKEAMRYRKHNANARDESVINDYLRDLRSSHMGEDEKPVTADDIDLSGVPKSYHKRIRTMLRKHESMWSGQLGEITVTEHHIDLKPGARPYKAQPRRAGLKERELTEFEVKKQLEANVVEPSMSEWAAPVLFVPKKDGKLRFCIDYRKLNEVTVKDSYPIPRMDDCLDSLGEATIFTGLDAYSGYWQMNVAKKDRHKTAFTCHAGTFQCVRMPFGLTNAPATFQRGLDMVLSKFKWKTCLVYLDDVIIYSKSVEDHIQHVDEVLTALREAGITLKISKCTFFSDKIEYLGHVIKPGRLEVDQANTKSLRDARPPTSKTQLRSFLGLVNVYRRFIEDFAKVAGPLNELLKKGAPDKFELNEAQLEAFRKLIDAVVSPKVLALPVPGLPYSIDSDACDYGVGCALFQTHPGGERKPIGFWSRTLNDAERNYGVPERECLAVMFALKTLRPYILYERFVLHTDQESLSWLMNIEDPSGRLLRWRLRLAEFDFEVKYKLGKLNTQADAMSRLFTDSEAAHEDMEDIPCFLAEESPEGAENEPCVLNNVADTGHDDEVGPDDYDLSDISADQVFATLPPPQENDPAFTPITHEELVTCQLSDSFCQETRRKMNTGEVRAFGFNDDGLLCRQVSHDQIIVPHVLKARVLHIHHHSRLAGHPGGRRLYYNLRRHMYWPSMAVDCYAVVRKCSTCAKNRIKLRQRSNPLRLFPPAGPLESVAIDIFGPLLKTARGNQYLLMITDRYSKLTKSVPMKTMSAEAVAITFTNEWALTYGPPADILADNGGCFTSKFFTSVCQTLNVRNKFTTTYHPQTNGQVERYNRTLKAMLKSYLDDHPHDWDLYARTLTYAYNCQPHTSTSLAPFELILSRPPPPLSVPQAPTTPEQPVLFRDRWRLNLRKVLKTSGAVMRATAARMKRNYDERLRRHRDVIKPGDFVFLRTERRDDNETRHKLAAIAEGPYRVESVRGNTVVIVYPDDKVERVSMDRVTLAPKSLAPEQIAKLLGPITDEEIVPSEYPIPQEVNLRDVLTPPNDAPRNTNATASARETRPEGPSPDQDNSRYPDHNDPTDLSVPSPETEDAPESPQPSILDPEADVNGAGGHPSNRLPGPHDSGNIPETPLTTARLDSQSAPHADLAITPGSAESSPASVPLSADNTASTPTLNERISPLAPSPVDNIHNTGRRPALRLPSTVQQYRVNTASTAGVPAANDSESRDRAFNTHEKLQGATRGPEEKPTQRRVRFAPTTTVHPVRSQQQSQCQPPPRRRELHNSAMAAESARRSKRTRTPSAKLRDSTNSGPTHQPAHPRGEGGASSLRVARNGKADETRSSSDEPAVLEQEYTIEKIVGHGANDDPGHPTASENETMLKVRWAGYGAADDTFEPIHHVPRNAVVSYFRRKQLPLPNDLSRAQAG